MKKVIPKTILDVIVRLVGEANAEKVYVSSAADLRIEREIAERLGLPVIANDISESGKFLGAYFSNKELPTLSLSENPELGFAESYCHSELEKLAVFLLLREIRGFLKHNNEYGERMLDNYKSEFESLVERTAQNIARNVFKLEDYFDEDILAFLKRASKKDDIVCYLCETASKPDLVGALISSGAKFVVIERVENVELSEFYKGKISTNCDFFIYTNIGTANFFVKRERMPKAEGIVPKICREDRIEGVSISEITQTQFSDLRTIYMSKKVTGFAMPQVCYGLFTDNKLFGAFGFSTDFRFKTPAELEKPTVYLVADFAVSPTCEKRLSKLVLFCILSKEVKLLAERLLRKESKTVYTNVFTDKAISMKYRGLFELYKNRVAEDSENRNLGYGASMGKWTLAEGVEKWKQK